jgi:hypothetical protein
VIDLMAGATRLELATSAVTGQRSNQLSYAPTISRRDRTKADDRQGANVADGGA